MILIDYVVCTCVNHTHTSIIISSYQLVWVCIGHSDATTCCRLVCVQRVVVAAVDVLESLCDGVAVVVI